MLTLEEAKKVAEEGSIEASLKYRRSAGFAIRAVGVLIVVVVRSFSFTEIINDYRQQNKSAQVVSREPQQGSLQILTMPPYGDSKRLLAIKGHPFSFTGQDFTAHCVYSDGTEGIVGDPIRPCSDGPILYVYVHDTSGKSNSVTYR